MSEEIVAMIKQADSRIEDLSLLDGRVTGFRVRVEDAGDAPLVVYLHGGGGGAFECLTPGRSALGTAADHGIPGFSLNRPGYHGSEWLGVGATEDDALYQPTAKVIDDALADLWERFGGESRGIVVYGASVGGAVAIDLARIWGEQAATGSNRWPLIGLIATDVGHAKTQEAFDCWNATEVKEVVDSVAPLVQQYFDFGPDWCRFGSPGEGGRALVIPRAEMLEITGGWARRALDQAASVTVPVLYRVGEFDPLWLTEDEHIAAFNAALRTSSPYVDGGRVDGASHGITGGPRGASCILEFVAFLELCRAAAKEPRLIDHSKR
ncbi:alpha/beta hydrolase family protein [Microbacterium sp. No. 7]|uniref:alpha/beta hydrolase family protein n=1 Tax=Microbacterium sp. No. 7 TaxID=1714373 RepID=UPI0006CFC451|nr:alpha/beta hydrolase [Microbacterium sp. No. 7]ALJ20069.1 hypothetical protein AOA12_09165 [Microbacterium sp. No. 7]